MDACVVLFTLALVLLLVGIIVWTIAGRERSALGAAGLGLIIGVVWAVIC